MDSIFGTCYEVNIKQLCSFSIQKYNMWIFLRPSDTAVHNKEKLYIPEQGLYMSALTQARALIVKQEYSSIMHKHNTIYKFCHAWVIL